MSGLGRILIVGANGQVGRELQRSFAGAGELLCCTRNEMNLASERSVRRIVRDFAPDLILNAAAYTAVDRAESEPAMAMAINAHAPRVLAEEASRCNSLLVHYSTDYVFDGTKQEAWVETDAPNPLNIYGASKLAGECAIQEVGGKYLVLRTSWVYGPHGNNFLLTMLRLAHEKDQLSVVDDQIGAPTSSIEIASGTRRLVEKTLAGECGPPEQWAGIYHMTCSGNTTWFGLATAIFAASAFDLKRAPRIQPISSEAYALPARRPRNSVLSNAKLAKHFGIELDGWEVALKAVIATLCL